jgi:hypothetical protein
MTVSVYFPGRAQMELRLLNGGALKRAPWKSATAADDTATFNTDTSFPNGDQLEAIASIGDERRIYKPVAAACSAEETTPEVTKAVKNPPANTQSGDSATPPNPFVYSPKEGDPKIQGFAGGFQTVEPRVMEGSSTIVIAGCSGKRQLNSHAAKKIRPAMNAIALAWLSKGR